MAVPREAIGPQSRFRALLTWIGRQALLVPEAAMLLVLLTVHIVLGAPPLTALLGVLVVGYFVSRSLLLLLAQHALDTARYEQAAKLARSAARLHPFSADAATLQGNIEMARNRPHAAEAAWRRALVFDPGRAAVYAALSSVLLEFEELDAARHAAEQALKLDARLAAAYLHLGNALAATGAAPPEVEQVLRDGIQHECSAVDAISLRCALAYVLLEDGRRAEAQLALRGSDEFLSDCPMTQRAGLYYHLGTLQRAFGEDEQAQSYFQASENLDPQGRHAAAAWRAARS